MEEKLKKIFDFQKFAQNKRLQALIDETEARGLHELSDDDLWQVNAAGDFFDDKEKKEK